MPTCFVISHTTGTTFPETRNNNKNYKKILYTNLSLELSVGDGSLGRRDWTIVNKGRPLTIPISHMSIDCIVTSICFTADKPVHQTKEYLI